MTNTPAKAAGATGLAALAISTAYLSQALLNVVSPILGLAQEAFPDASPTTVQLIMSLPTLMAVFAGLIVASVVKALGYKNTWGLALLLIIVGGVLPALFSTNLTAILVCRVVFGIGYGLAYPLCAMTVQAYIAAEKQPKAMGNGTMFMNVGNILFPILAGLVAGLGWSNAFWLHAIMALPLVLIFLSLKEPVAAQVEAAVQGEEAPAAPAPAVQGSTTRALAYIAAAGVTMIFLFGYAAFASFVAQAKGFTAAEASYIITSTAISGLVAGSIFGYLYKAVGRKVYAVAAAVLLIGNVLLVIGTNLPVLIVSGLFVGFGLSVFLTSIFIGIAEDFAPAQAGRYTGFATTSMNLFSFLGVYILNFLGGLISEPGDPVAPFYFAIGYFAIMLIVSFFIKTPKKN